MTTDGPRKAVFDTAELLENVMLYVPPKNVFGAQRMCRQFRDIVATSVKLRQKLFLRSTGQEEESWSLQVPLEAGYLFLPTIRAAKPYWSTSRDTGAQDPRSESKRVTPTQLNLLRSLNHRSWGATSSSRAAAFPFETANLPFKIIQYTKASWRGTFLTDPPCREATISLFWKAKAKPPIEGRVIRTVASDVGVTLGQLVDAALYKIGQVQAWIKNKITSHEATTLVDVVAALGAVTGSSVMVDVPYTHIDVKGVTIPTEEEWAMMRECGNTRGREKRGSKEVAGET